MGRICPSCRHEFDDRAAACPVCGSPPQRVHDRPVAARGVELLPPRQRPPEIARYEAPLDPAVAADQPAASPIRASVAAPTRPPARNWRVRAAIGGAVAVAVAIALIIDLRSQRPAASSAPARDTAASSAPLALDLGSDSDFVFGGRTARWWSEQLTALRQSSDAEAARRYRLGKQRAESLGLVVVETGATVTVQRSPDLDQLIDRRMGP